MVRGSFLKVVLKLYLYLKELLALESVSNFVASGCVSRYGSSVFVDHQTKLSCPIKKEEMKAALFAMHPKKALSPKGYLAGFFQGQLTGSC